MYRKIYKYNELSYNLQPKFYYKECDKKLTMMIVIKFLALLLKYCTNFDSKLKVCRMTYITHKIFII